MKKERHPDAIALSRRAAIVCKFRPKIPELSGKLAAYDRAEYSLDRRYIAEQIVALLRAVLTETPSSGR